MIPLCEAQLTTYLRLSGCRVGFLMNFNVVEFKDGPNRLVRYRDPTYPPLRLLFLRV